MQNSIRNHIEILLGAKLITVRAMSGGVISNTYLLETATERFFCKVNNGKHALPLFQAEKEGLGAISKTNAIATPQILCCEAVEDVAYMLMEYVQPKEASAADMEKLGRQVAVLHQTHSSHFFGFENDNFVGSLPQSNTQHESWSSFYVQERLLPQLKAAKDGQRLTIGEIPTENRIFKTCESIFPKVRPALLHGDLWSGNYLIRSDGTPFIIDPAVYYGHYEVDLAMTALFGGFQNTFYHAHSEHFPKIGGEHQ